MTKYRTCTVQYHVQGQGMIEQQKSLFSIKVLHKQWKIVIVTHFTMKIIRTYLYITCNKKILFVKNIVAYCGYSPTSPFFPLLSEHKHCDNAATNSNSVKARSRMLASLRGSVGTGTKEDKASTGRVWAAGFHHVTARSRLERVLKYMNRLFL